MDMDSEGSSDPETGSSLESGDDEVTFVEPEGGGVSQSTIHAFKQELTDETQVECMCRSIETEGNKMDKILTYYQDLYDEYIIPSYQDITKMFIDGNVFLVCGDSLILNVMGNANYRPENGGQMLHLVYLCERLLQLFLRKGGAFEVVFFDIWKDTWLDNHSTSLARSVLLTHLQKNTTVPIHQFTAIWDPEFSRYLTVHKPSFLLVNLDIPDVYRRLSPNLDLAPVNLAFYSQVLFSIAFNLPCVDMGEVLLDVSTLHAFVIDGVPRLKKTLLRTLRHLNLVIKTDKQQRMSQRKSWNTEFEYQHYEAQQDARRILTVTAAAWYLIEETAESHAEDWIRNFLLHSALMEVLPLRHRSCPFPTTIPTKNLTRFIDQIQCHMNRALENIIESGYSYKNIPDLWHGNLFVNTLRLLSAFSGVEDVLSQVGTQTEEVYKELSRDISKIIKRKFDISPITESSINWHEVGDVVEEGNTIAASSTSFSSSSSVTRAILDKLVPTSCLLTHEFCGELLNEMHEQTKEYDNRMDMFVARERGFTETHHWHSHKPLTDEQDRISNNEEVRSMNEKEKKRLLRIKAKFATFMNIYGSNVEGRYLVSKPIICKNKDSSTTKKHSKSKASSKESKKGKVSKNALKIKEANIKKKQEFINQMEQGKLRNFEKAYKTLKVKRNYQLALREAKNLLENIHTRQNIQIVLLYIAEMHYMLWCDECSTKKNPPDRDLNLAKELFLVLRRLLQESKQNDIPLLDTDKRRVGLWLWRLGFKEVAQQWEVPQPKMEDKSYEVGTSWVRFQLLNLGPELERTSKGKPDHRVDFIPDPWQKELFDVIDHRQSAVIVAPTSSGKTYASYYCMESILREDNEGVVVYVAPTKALVNQVAATVYARFKGKDMPDGKAVYGVFTRDYRTNDMNSQILITVPQCLELLLLSPRRHTWVKKLRYVIFDEIHCLAGQAGGVSWECGLLLIRCPFLALSATVHKPEILYEWLQSAENLKQQRDKLDGCERPSTSYKVRLVVHQERHNDLKKYVYTASGTFLHIHPYAHVDMMVIKEHCGIPGHISLSPEEALQLYLAMESVAPQDAGIIHFMPETYFKNSGFVTRPEVREYERNLRDVLQKWAFEDQTAFESVLKQLSLKLEMANNDECGMDFIATNFIKFIHDLQKENMFPAIIFRYDKSHIDFLFSEFVKHCEVLEKEDQRTDNKPKHEYPLDKKQKELKSLCHSVGKSSKVLENASGIGDISLRRYGGPCVDNISLDLLEGQSSASIRNVGVVDEDDVKYIEHRLVRVGYRRNHEFPSGLRMGMGKHHGAMNVKERSSVEMLFRMKVLNVVLATGTLALGIHMPCKTVVIAGDSPFLNSLEFHQMSGRAGRRGFDTSGNVVFFGLAERKTRTLLTGKLPIMIGNFPLTVTLVLRLLLLVSDVTDKGCRGENVKSDALSRALTYLNCSLVYQSIPELKPQMKHFFSFSTQLLILQGLLDNEGNPQNLTGLITHLHYHEPGNLVLVYLLRSGALRRLCQPGKNGVISRDTELKLVLVLSYLFARHPLHNSCLDRKYNNSKVVLPPLPSDMRTEVKNYNEEVGFIYDHYFQCVARHFAESMGDDDTLPLSKVRISPSAPAIPNATAMNLETLVMRENEPRKICSAFAALSGHTDKKLYSHNNIISNIRHQVFTDVKVIPVLDYELQLNAYAWDFYNHGIVEAISEDNGIRRGDVFFMLNDFKLMLRTIYTCLEELGIGNEDDPVLKTFRIVAYKYGCLFNKGFNLAAYSLT